MTTKLEWVLRIGVFGTFLGHGLLAVSVVDTWIPYITMFGISAESARLIMPVIGSLDIIIAFWVLIRPNKYVIIWAVFWAFSTALIRPVSGELFLAFVERAANWAVPLALYFYRIGISENKT